MASLVMKPPCFYREVERFASVIPSYSQFSPTYSLVPLVFFRPTSSWKGALKLCFSRQSLSSMPDPRLLPPPLVFMSQNCPPPRTDGTRRSSLFGERWKMGIENFSEKTTTTTMLTRPSHFLPHDDHGQAGSPIPVEAVRIFRDKNDAHGVTVPIQWVST